MSSECFVWCHLCKKYISLVGGVADKHTLKGKPCRMSGKSLKEVMDAWKPKGKKVK